MSQELPYLQQIRDTSNTSLDILLANINTAIGVAYGAANVGISIGQAAYGQANLAYAAGNSGISQAQGALAVGQAAYGQANAASSLAATALSVGQTAYGQANLAYAAANSGISQAQNALAVAEAAFATANSGVAASGVTAGNYGSGSAIPVFNVDSRGRITAITTAPYNTFTPSSSGIVPASGGIAGQFLASDATFKVPAFASSQTLTANGNIQLAGGLTLQWGQFASSVNGGSPIQTTPFSLTFNNGTLFVVAVANGAVPIEVLSFTRSQFLWAPSFGGGAAGAVSAVRYFAIGF